jgi:hypothetical protein
MWGKSGWGGVEKSGWGKNGGWGGKNGGWGGVEKSGWGKNGGCGGVEMVGAVGLKKGGCGGVSGNLFFEI